jgi:hypothetical protein
MLDQKHYTVPQIAEALNVSHDVVARLFRDQEGVVKLTQPGNRGKRAYVTLRIPESVLKRVYAGMTSGVTA